MNSKPSLAVCIPSRGLIHTRTIEALLNQLKGIEYELFMSHDLPIPECFNSLTLRAMESGADRILFIEEDMLLPDDIISTMLSCDEPIVTADYPVAKVLHVVTHGDITQIGTGCLLVKREVFMEFNYPYFESVSYDYYSGRRLDLPSVYGGHDVFFSYRVDELGYKIKVISQPAGQYRIKEYGKSESNNGCHLIEEWNFVT